MNPHYLFYNLSAHACIISCAGYCYSLLIAFLASALATLINPAVIAILLKRKSDHALPLLQTSNDYFK